MVSQLAVRNSEAESISSENIENELSSTPADEEPAADRGQRRRRDGAEERLDPVQEVEVVVEERRRRVGWRAVVELEGADAAVHLVRRRDRAESRWETWDRGVAHRSLLDWIGFASVWSVPLHPWRAITSVCVIASLGVQTVWIYPFRVRRSRVLP